MRITEMSFEKKVLTSQWEHEILKVTAVTREGENDPSSRVKELVSFVQTRGDTTLNGVATVVKTEVRMGEAASQTSSAEATTSPTAKEKKEKKEKKSEVKTEEKSEVKSETKPEEKTEAKSEASTEEKTEAKTEAKTEDKTEKKTKKSVPYSRTNETHKKLVGELLDSRYPGWRSSPNKYVEASKKLEGQDLLNDEGIILESFKEKFDAEVK